MIEHLLVGCPPGTLGVVTDSGWTDSKVFVQWLNHFVEAVKPTSAKDMILFVDGHIGRRSLEAVELARANDIELISFPPNTTHRLQPLDNCYFGSRKGYYTRGVCDYWMSRNAGNESLSVSVTLRHPLVLEQHTALMYKSDPPQCCHHNCIFTNI